MNEKDQLLAKLSEPQKSRIAGALDQIQEANSEIPASLDLSARYLVSQDLELLWPYIQKIESLESLDLSKNALTTIPWEINRLMSIKVLVLSDNIDLEIPENIGELKHLEKLYLNRIGATKIPESIGDLTSLTVLNLDRNPNLRVWSRAMNTLSPQLDISLDLVSFRTASQIRLIDHFNNYAAMREGTFHKPYNPYKEVLDQVYSEQESLALWKQIQSMDLGLFEVEEDHGKSFYSTYKVMIEFLKMFPLGDPLARDVYGPIAKQLFDELLDSDSPTEKKKDILQLIAVALGQCGTPVKQLLTQFFIGQCKEKKEQLPIDIQAFLVALAVEQVIRKEMADQLKGPEAAEQLAALLHCLFLRDQPELAQNPIPISGLEGYPTLPQFSDNVEFGFLELDEDMIQSFAQLCCKTGEDGVLLQEQDKYLLDPKKINGMVEAFLASLGIVSPREQAVQDYGQALQALLQSYDNLTTLYYQDPEVITLSAIQDRQQHFRERLQEVSDKDIDKELALDLATKHQEIKKLSQIYTQKFTEQQHALSAMAKVSGGLTRSPSLGDLDPKVSQHIGGDLTPPRSRKRSHSLG